MPEEAPVILEDYRDLATLDRASFPPAEQFTVRWVDDFLEFGDESLGLRVVSPWWDRADVERWTRTAAGAPLGGLDEPFDDLEQGWHVLVWRIAGDVFVLVGAEEVFPVRFRVTAQRYLDEWAALASGADS